MNQNFFAPTHMITGEDCVLKNGKSLSGLGKRCLIVTGKNSAKSSGALADVEKVLCEQNISYTVFDGITQNPTVSSCRKGGDKAIDYCADFILGIGGGSPLDASKAIAVFATDKDLNEDGLYAYEWKRDPLPVVCIGTTAGTGSEVTPVAVLTASDGRKKSIRDDRIIPKLAFGDSKYLRTLPLSFMYSCAVDALSHGVESYFSKISNDFSQMFSLRACEMLLPLLEKGLINLDEKEIGDLYLSSVYAGYAISVTGTAFPHAMGYFLSEEHSVPHGNACAVFLPEFLNRSLKEEPEKAEYFLKKTGYAINKVTEIVKKISPETKITLSDDDIKRLYPRWKNNNGLLRSPGNFSADSANDLLKKLFI